MITLKQVRVGSVVMVRPGFGGSRAEQATIVNVESDIKNGFPGIDYYTGTDADDCSWAYLTQIDRVVTY